MKTQIEFNGYDTLLQPTDWRFAAAVTGLCKYFDYFMIDYKILYEMEEKPTNYIHGFDGILYRSEDITEKRYLEFVESYFKNDMTHLKILDILQNEEYSDEQIKLVNDFIKSKSVPKNLLGKVKFDGTNKDVFISSINENREEIIKNIFKNGNNLYKNYCNERLLFTGENSTCRLRGYNVDKDRKTSSLGFCFSKESFDSNDILEFDFIPFAFSNSDMRETFFVNNNYSVKSLKATNQALSYNLTKTDNQDSKNRLLVVLQNAKDYIYYDVEIISKSQDKDFYSSLYVRLDRLERLWDLSENQLKKISNCKDVSNLNLAKEVYTRCLNNVLLDDVILKVLKNCDDYIVTDILIEINNSWKGNTNMEKILLAKRCAFLVYKNLNEMDCNNALISYKHKLINAMCADDYVNASKILMKLSECSGVHLAFIYDFFDAPEKNANLIYAFISALRDTSSKNIEDNN